MTPLLELDDVHARYGRRGRCTASRCARRRLEPGAARGQRRGQDDDVARDLRPRAQDGAHLVRRPLDRAQVAGGRRPARCGPRAAGTRHHRRPLVEDNLRLGAYTRRDRAAVRADTASVLEQFPTRRAPVTGGGDALRGRAADARARPRAAPASTAADARRAVARPGAADRPRDLRRARAAEPRGRSDGAGRGAGRGVALRVCEEACVLEVGHVAVSGPSEQLVADESVRKAYLGY